MFTVRLCTMYALVFRNHKGTKTEYYIGVILLKMTSTQILGCWTPSPLSALWPDPQLNPRNLTDCVRIWVSPSLPLRVLTSSKYGPHSPKFESPESNKMHCQYTIDCSERRRHHVPPPAVPCNSRMSRHRGIGAAAADGLGISLFQQRHPALIGRRHAGSGVPAGPQSPSQAAVCFLLRHPEEQ